MVNIVFLNVKCRSTRVEVQSSTTKTSILSLHIFFFTYGIHVSKAISYHVFVIFSTSKYVPKWIISLSYNSNVNS
jgi:hypothetical protein